MGQVAQTAEGRKHKTDEELYRICFNKAYVIFTKTLQSKTNHMANKVTDISGLPRSKSIPRIQDFQFQKQEKFQTNQEESTSLCSQRPKSVGQFIHRRKGDALKQIYDLP